MTFRVVISLVLALGIAPAAARAQQPSFPLTTPDGTVAPASVLDSPGQWLLVYAVPGSGPADRLVQWLGEGWTPQDAARIVFVLAGSPQDAKAYLRSKGGEALAAGARWYADPARDAAKALKLQGTLAVMGMVEGRTDWKIDGIIADPSVLQDPITRWLR